MPLQERRLEPRPQSVLVVDDYADLRTMWRLWLSMWGFEEREAANRRKATEKAFSKQPSFGLVDLSMQVSDGVSAVQRLGSDPRTSDLTVIGVTAHGRTHPAFGAFEAACDLLLEKPVEPETLLVQLRRVLSPTVKRSR